MENIFVYAPETLTLKNVIISRKITAAMWNRRFYDAGSFQLNLQSNILQKGDIIRHGEKAGIVMKVFRDLSGTVVYGYTLNAITQFRHIFKPESFNGTPEEIITQIATLVLTQGDRKIPTLSVLSGQTRNNTEYTLNFDNNNVFEKLKEFCKLTEISYDIQFDGESLVFKCVQGRDMVDFLQFGRRYRNVESMEYTLDDYNTKNVVYSSYEEIDKETETSTTIYTTTGEASGFMRRETGTTNTDEIQTIISNNKTVESLKGVANEKWKYREKWLLGDYVTVAFEDMITEKQIVEVQEIYEGATTTILPIFGEEKENPIRKLMQGG